MEKNSNNKFSNVFILSIKKCLIMKKEYMIKRLIDWCRGHNAVFRLFDNGAVHIHYKDYNSVWCDLFYPSVSYAYKKLIIEQDFRILVDVFDDDGDNLPF